jgi:hypothetical protein
LEHHQADFEAQRTAERSSELVVASRSSSSEWTLLQVAEVALGDVVEVLEHNERGEG